jgi:hypothetical protein
MRPCPQCGSHVLGADCPHCGARLAAGSGRSTLAAALLGLAVACTGKDVNGEETGTPDTDTVDTTAQPPYGIGTWTTPYGDADADADSDADADADADADSDADADTGGSGR